MPKKINEIQGITTWTEIFFKLFCFCVPPKDPHRSSLKRGTKISSERGPWINHVANRASDLQVILATAQ
jgi:hypothetical protein